MPPAIPAPSTATSYWFAGAAEAGADVELIWVRNLDLPLYTAGRSVPEAAQAYTDAMYGCDAMIWSSLTYRGSVSGSFENAMDWLILLAERSPPYPSSKPVGLVTTAGGVQDLQAFNCATAVVVG